MEAENTEMKEMRQIIDTELEKRDKAIAEAVAMIVRLEEQVSELVREKEMVRFIESDRAYCHSRSEQATRGDESNVVPLTPKMKSLDLFGAVESGKTLERVPSFLSERSEQTENLRNVVLNGRSNQARMRRVSEASAEPNELHRVASPSLSMLSESSFKSVYGSKDENAEDTAALDADEIAADDTPLAEPRASVNESSVERWRSQRGSPASWMQKAVPQGGANLTGQLQPVSKVIDITSPLQKIEMLEKQFPNVMEGSRSSTPSYNRNTPTASPRSARPKQGAFRQENRGNIHKIVTGGPTNKELANSHILPPTPDTVASSTLRKHQDFSSSQDSLNPRSGPQQGGFPPVSEISDSASSNKYCRPSPRLQDSNMQRASTTAFTSGQGLSMPPIATEWLTRPHNQMSMDLPPRPRSAGETTLSRARANSWISDSDSESGGADARSEESAFDYWMRESIRPDTKHGRRSAPPKKDERVRSPDLFSFPGESGGWGPDALFGAMQGNDFLGAPIPSLRRERIDDMTTALGAPQTAQLEPQQIGHAPPTPHRKSSLHAHTGSLSVSASPASGGGRSMKGPPALNSALNRITRSTKSRSSSIDSGGQSLNQHQQQHLPEAPSPSPTPSKRSQYPPIAGQGMRRSLGLNSLFRRSGSEAPSSEAAFPPPSSHPAEGRSSSPSGSAMGQLPLHVQSQFAASRAGGRSSVPPPPRMPWAMRPPPALVDDEFDRATPPPIARSRGQSLSQGAGPADSGNDYAFTAQQLQQQLQEEMMIAEEFGMMNHAAAAKNATMPPSSPSPAPARDRGHGGGPPASPASPAPTAGSRRSRWLNLGGRMSSSLKNRSG